jgi:hypothetical protein
MDTTKSYNREKSGSFHQRKINLVYNKLIPQFQAEIGVLFLIIDIEKIIFRFSKTEIKINHGK